MTCPRCSCPDCQAARLDPVEAKALELRQACRRAGISVSPDDFVSLAGAALLLGLSTKTLQNWRSEGVDIESRRIGGKVQFSLVGIARRLISGAETQK